MRPARLATQLLDLTDRLSGEAGDEAVRRRSVSGSYYAVFHAIAELCADCLVGSDRHGEDDYRRVYRALDHGPLRNAFAQGQLRAHRRFAPLGEAIVHLQTERHRADYEPSDENAFSANDIRDLAKLARVVIEDLRSIEPSSTDARLLATCLLFKDRRS